MGCGSSAPAAAAEQRPKELTEQEKNAIAVQALKDALGWAAKEAIQLGKAASTWQEDGIKIVVPCMDRINTLKEKVASVPLIGSQLVKALDAATEPFEEQFQNAAMTVCGDSRTLDTFTSIVSNLDPSNAVHLCREGGVSACADYLRDFAKAMLRATMTPVINDLMSKHPLTNIWKTAIEAYNTAARKVDLEELHFDLNEYVLESTLNSLHKLILKMERQIREAPAKAVSFAVQQVFGKINPNEWRRN